MNNKKESNPKDAIGTTKVPFSCLPTPVLAECAVGMLEGACKYGRHNYRVIGVRASVYYDATLRHLMAWYEGENLDPDSDVHHVTKAITSLMVLRDAMIRGMMEDDRPPQTHDFIKVSNEETKKVLEKYPDPLPAYTAERVSKGEDLYDVFTEAT
jgi:hypothetical protein